MTTYRGKIDGFAGSWGSGLGYLVVDGRSIPCDNGPTVRALEACFGGVIGKAHDVVGGPSWVGKEIVYSVDEVGLLAGFTPAEDWNGPEIPPEGLEDADSDDSDE